MYILSPLGLFFNQVLDFHMRIFHENLRNALIGLLLCSVMAVGQENAMSSRGGTLGNSVVATIGNIAISSNEFQMNYEYGPAFLKRQADSKRRYLNIMINEKILALEGYARNLEQSSHVKNILSQIRADIITEELFRDDIMSSIVISDREVGEALELDMKHIHIRWIYRRSLNAMEQDLAAIKRGASFDSLFTLRLGKDIPRDDRSLETTLFRLKRKNPVLFSVIDTLKTGRLTAPIKAGDGYYLVKVISGWTNAMPTETEWNNRAQKIRNALYKSKMDSLSDIYVKKLMDKHSPVIQKPAFKALCSTLATVALPGGQSATWFGEQQQPLGALPEKSASDILVRLNPGDFSTRDFISWYIPRRAYIKLPRSSREAFQLAVQKMIWRMVRDMLLTETALRRGIQNRAHIKQQLRWWEEKVVYAKYKLELARSITVNDMEIQEYYSNNLQDFKTKKGGYQPLGKVKTEITHIIRRDKYSRYLINKLQSARQKYPVRIREQVLRDIKVDMENNPRAVEVYTVKKGGLFPRQPYPTIDSEWKYWYQ